jgi:hypothetical protein
MKYYNAGKKESMWVSSSEIIKINPYWLTNYYENFI